MGDAPSAVAVAVPAPSVSDPVYPAFLVLAGRLLTPTQGRGWQASYDPIKRPELLFFTGRVGQGERSEPAAARIRAEVAQILERPALPGENAKTRETFRLFLDRSLDPATCAKDARAFAIARARRTDLRLDTVPIVVESVAKSDLDEAAKLFDPMRTAAVIAGGAIR